MIRHVSCVRLMAIIVALSFAAPVSAALLYEPFDYASGQGLAGMNGQVGNQGLTPPAGTPNGLVAPNGNTWMSGNYSANNPYSSALDAVTIATDLSYLNLVKNPGTGSVTLGGNGSIPRIAFSPIGHGPGGSAVDVFYSYVFRLDSLANTPAVGGFLAALNNGRGSQPGNLNTAGASVFARASGAGFVLGVLEQGSDPSQATFDTDVRSFGESYFVVGKYTIKGTLNFNTMDDTAQIWINPISLGGAEPAGALVALNQRTDMPTNAGDGSAVAQSFYFRSGALGQTGNPTSIVFDELRIGHTYADVTPVVPEPGTMAMVVLIGALMSGLRRRS